MEGLEIAGQWWMPSNADRKVPGILKFNHADGGVLTLIGGLRRPEDLAVPEQLPGGGTRTTIRQEHIDAAGNYGRLLGLCEGRALTLEGCFQLRSRGSFVGPTYEEIIHVNHVYDGVWFGEAESADGDSVTFGLDGLNAWTGQSGILLEMRSPVPEDEPVVSMHGRNLEDQSISIDNNGTVTLSHTLRTSNPQGAVLLSEDFSFQIQFPNRVPVEQLLDVASDIQDVVSIATDRTAQYTSVKVTHPELFQERNGTRIPNPFTVWSAWPALQRRDAKPANRHEVYFTLEDIGGMSGLSRLLAVAERHRSELGRVLATIYSDRMYVSDRFLNRVAAVEGFDRVDSGIGEGRSFANRIRACIALAGPQFATVLHNVERWVSELRNHRNEVAHHYGRRMRQETEAQFVLANGAYWLFVFCLLRKASAPSAIFDKLVSHRKIQYLAQQNRALFP